MRDKTTFIQKHSIKLVLLVCLLGGSLGVSWLEPYRGTEHLAAYGEHFFMAIAISGAIGLVIEFTLYKELAKNVFEAAIGYLLPPELHGELKWIYGLPFICEKHVHTVTIERVPDTQLVQVTQVIVRTLKNITDSEQPIDLSCGMDDWSYDQHPSKYLAFTYQLEGGLLSDNLANQARKRDVGWGIAVDELRIKRGQRVTSTLVNPAPMSSTAFMVVSEIEAPAGGRC